MRGAVIIKDPRKSQLLISQWCLVPRLRDIERLHGKKNSNCWHRFQGGSFACAAHLGRARSSEANLCILMQPAQAAFCDLCNRDGLGDRLALCRDMDTRVDRCAV
eukprot:CAMPEP_0115827576 /NCGR_PEP_ID=MMETSP0287-20121206/117_1 /TAXON_ID=412157 /ORGANISM="Chrysochromulina rotalis, Strain UIO044" /LENGTH=104 /DNA_ID=CAMNT_0003280741 /DNA_START=338 /DNA_END=652 /DNA_ORIENTATION=+